MKTDKIFSAALFDELETLYPDTDCADGKESLHIAAAAGTYPGVAVMLNNLTPGQAVAFSISVKNHAGRPKNWKLFSMQAVPVEFNTSSRDRTELVWENDYNPDTIRRAPFFAYEILKPIINVDMAQYASQAYVFRFLSCAEKYQLTPFEIQITHCGITKTLSLIAEEYPVKVPAAGKDTHKYVNWFSLDNMAKYHSVPKWSPEFGKLLYKYFRAAAYTRQNVIAVNIGDYIEKREDGEFRFNEARLDVILETAEKAGMYWIEGGALTRRQNGDWGTSNAEVSTDGTVIPGEGEQTLHKITKALYAYIQKHHLENRWAQSVLDEPGDELAATYKLASSIVKEEMPGIPVLEPTIGSDSLAGAVDIWCPPINIFEKQLDFFKKRKEAGDKIFVYTCLNPGGKYCNRLLDMEKLRQVYIGWANAAYPLIDGFLHWGGNQYCGRNPYDQSCVQFEEDNFDYTTNRDMILPAGDGFIFYPGQYGQVYSGARAEAHRIGFEDLELLRMCAAKDADYTRQLVGKLFRNYQDYDTDIEHYRTVKKEMLDFLTEK